jgi:ATP-dependent DNA helicase PIF1
MTFNLNDKQTLAFNFMKDCKNIFISGPAGCGKSFIVKYFIDYYKSERETDNSKIYITSTTGLSSLIIDGITINRYSGIGTGEKDVEEYYKKIKKIHVVRKRWLNTGVLIIDEISMMNPDIFDKLELLARKIRNNDIPFGGIQIILCGDFLQLPPINSNKFCFESQSWNNVIDKTIYFDKIIRQNDIKLQNVLNNIRLGIVNDEVKELLNSCLHKNNNNNDDNIKPTLLYSRKNMVSIHNIKELNKLVDSGYKNFIYYATYEFSKNISNESKQFYKDILNNQYQVEDNITFSLNSQVMLIINIPDYKLANGSRGIIIDFTVDTYPIVKFLNGVILEIKPHNFLIDENNNTFSKNQIPLIHAWAITIHKAQGMTLELLQTDIGSSIFEYGQAYVVLSRIKNIEGLSLINIDYSKIKAHPKVLEYYKNLV